LRLQRALKRLTRFSKAGLCLSVRRGLHSVALTAASYRRRALLRRCCSGGERTMADGARCAHPIEVRRERRASSSEDAAAVQWQDAHAAQSTSQRTRGALRCRRGAFARRTVCSERVGRLCRALQKWPRECGRLRPEPQRCHAGALSAGSAAVRSLSAAGVSAAGPASRTHGHTRATPSLQLSAPALQHCLLQNSLLQNSPDQRLPGAPGLRPLAGADAEFALGRGAACSTNTSPEQNRTEQELRPFSRMRRQRSARSRSESTTSPSVG
jgi:hypothetical protein